MHIETIPDNTPDCVPDYVVMTKPEAVLHFIFAGLSRRVLNNFHHLRIQFNFPYDANCPKHEMYLLAIRIVLRIMTQLDDLVLLWDGVPSRVFHGVSFQLLALTCTMEVDADVLSFLRHQPHLRMLELPNWFGGSDDVTKHHLTSPQTFLPDLVELSVPPTVIMGLVPGRTIHSVDVRVSSKEDVVDWRSMMEELAKSATPIYDLSLATLSSFPLSVLDAVECIPSLQSLYLRVYSPPDSTQDIFQWGLWEPYLARLPFLESIKVEIDCRFMEPSSTARFVIPTGECMQRWANSLPELCSIYVGLYAGDTLTCWERSLDPRPSPHMTIEGMEPDLALTT